MRKIQDLIVLLVRNVSAEEMELTSIANLALYFAVNVFLDVDAKNYKTYHTIIPNAVCA